jgi:hypothetical protein
MLSVDIIDTPTFLPISVIKKLLEKINGRKTVTVVRVEAKIDRQTSIVP